MAIKLNRFLEQRGRGFRYERAVPRDVAHLDHRAPKVRILIDTPNLIEARRRRDILAVADDAYWSALRSGVKADTARAQYHAQVALQHAVGLTHVEESDYRRMSLDERMALGRNMLNAFERINGKPVGQMTDAEFEETRAVPAQGMHPVLSAALSRQGKPLDTLRDALDAHVERERGGSRRSPNQTRKWEERRRRAVAGFEAVIGRDLPMSEISRDHAFRYERWWRDRIEREGLTHDMASKAFAVLRAVYHEHFDRQGDVERRDRNPFNGIKFARIQHTERQPIERRWIEERWLADPAALAAMNDEERRILIVVAETGARPSEVCNLIASGIHLDSEIPYIEIKPRPGRALKAKASARKIPLVGAALVAMRQHPEGFKRYLDKEDSLSGTLNKYLRENDLLPGPDASVYGLRHGYIDRLRAAGVGDDLRRAIVGQSGGGIHAGYGSGFTLTAMRDAMTDVACSFDPAAI